MFENLHSHAQYVYFHNDLYGEGNIITLVGGLKVNMEMHNKIFNLQKKNVARVHFFLYQK